MHQSVAAGAFALKNPMILKGGSVTMGKSRKFNTLLVVPFIFQDKEKHPDTKSNGQ